jgi:hypothetical protein
MLRNDGWNFAEGKLQWPKRSNLEQETPNDKVPIECR